VLIAMNVAVFVLVAIADPKSLTGGAVTEMQFRLGLNKLLLSVTHEWYRLVTSGFLHFGFIHIGFNMLLLYQLGQILERALGRLGFGMLYAASLLGGSFGVLILNGDSRSITGGASGAVFGLMAAAAIGMHRQGISIGGHLGGAVAGAICGWFMLAPRHRRTGPAWQVFAVPTAVIVVSVVGSVALTLAV
jgi:membrane associated rhomboid family serine protease